MTVTIERRRRLVGRQPQGERRPNSGLGPDRALAAMVLADMLDDREPQSRTAGDPRARLVYAVEALENAIEVVHRNADALILDRDLDDRIGELCADGNPRVAGRV